MLFIFSNDFSLIFCINPRRKKSHSGIFLNSLEKNKNHIVTQVNKNLFNGRKNSISQKKDDKKEKGT